MKWFRYCVPLTLGLALLTGACSVNELPQYRSRISTVHLAFRVERVPEVIFVSPHVVDPEDPEDVAIEVMESRIRERLADRIDRHGHPDGVEALLDESLRQEFERRFPWTLARPGEEYDTLFAVRLERYGVSVDATGVAALFFDTTVEGRFLETGTLIYEETVRSELPLTEIYRGEDAVSEAAARALNMMALDQLTEAAFREQVARGVEQAARLLMDEMFRDTWD